MRPPTERLDCSVPRSRSAPAQGVLPPDRKGAVGRRPTWPTTTTETVKRPSVGSFGACDARHVFRDFLDFFRGEDLRLAEGRHRSSAVDHLLFDARFTRFQ